MNDSHQKRSNALTHAVWAGVLVVVIVAAFLAGRHIIDRIDAGARDAMNGAKEEIGRYAKKAETLAKELAVAAENTAAKFKTGTITQTFSEEIPVFLSLGTGRLEVSIADPVTTTFSKSDTRKILWDWISLGETVSEIRVPATYRYHVPLDGYWKLEVHDHICMVIPPSIRPSLPVAIYTDQMEKKTTSGWARFDKQDQLDELERSITPRLNEIANDQKHLSEARDKGRVTIAKFVRAWLLREGQWGGEQFTSIIVVFPDEPTQGLPPATLAF